MIIGTWQETVHILGGAELPLLLTDFLGEVGRTSFARHFLRSQRKPKDLFIVESAFFWVCSKGRRRTYFEASRQPSDLSSSGAEPGRGESAGGCHRACDGPAPGEGENAAGGRRDVAWLQADPTTLTGLAFGNTGDVSLHIDVRETTNLDFRCFL